MDNLTTLFLRLIHFYTKQLRWSEMRQIKQNKNLNPILCTLHVPIVCRWFPCVLLTHTKKIKQKQKTRSRNKNIYWDTSPTTAEEMGNVRTTHNTQQNTKTRLSYNSQSAAVVPLKSKTSWCVVGISHHPQWCCPRPRPNASRRRTTATNHTHSPQHTWPEPQSHTTYHTCGKLSPSDILCFVHVKRKIAR